MKTAPPLPTWDQYGHEPDVAGPFENQILYRMCRDHPRHDEPYVTAGKIMAIGRIYAASPERRAGEARKPGATLPEAIGRKLATIKFDSKLDGLIFESRLSVELVPSLVSLHSVLVRAIADATEAWSSKAEKDENWSASEQRSFASKYLHFHRPNAFPINDRFVRAGLQCVNGKGVTTYNALCLGVLKVAAQQKADWTPRELDTYLLEAGRTHEARENGACARCGTIKRRRPTKVLTLAR